MEISWIFHAIWTLYSNFANAGLVQPIGKP